MKQKTILVLLPTGLQWSQVFKVQEFTSSLQAPQSDLDAGLSMRIMTAAAQRSIRRGALLYRASATFDRMSAEVDLVLVPSIGPPLPENLWKNEEVSQFIHRMDVPVLVIGTGALLLPEHLFKQNSPLAFPRSFDQMIQTLKLRSYFDLRSWYTETKQVLSIADESLIPFALTQWMKRWLSRKTFEQIRSEFNIRPPLFDQRIFRSFHPRESHDDLMVMRAQTMLREGYKQDWNIEELAHRLYISRRQFDRRFRRATGYSAPEYLKRIRMHAAAKQLRESRPSVEEIARDMGYGDTDAFRSVFKSFFGCTPSQYRTFYR